MNMACFARALVLTGPILTSIGAHAQDVRGYTASLAPIDFSAGIWSATVHLYVDGETEVPRPFIRQFGFNTDTLWLTNTTQVDNEPVVFLKEYAGTIHLDPGPGSTVAIFPVGPRTTGIHNVPNSEETSIEVMPNGIINSITGSLGTLPLATNWQSNVSEANGTYTWDPGLVDPDGDSLSVALIPCVSSGYWSPAQTQIDALTGELSVTPEEPGAYTFCMSIFKWRMIGQPGMQQAHLTGRNYLEILIDVTTVVGFEEITVPNRLSMFPNPAREEVSIDLPSTVSSGLMVLFADALGRTVLGVQYAPGEPIDVSHLDTGTYTVQVHDKHTGVRLTARFIRL